MVKIWKHYSREYNTHIVSCKNLNPRNSSDHSVSIYLVLYLLCLNDFSCLDALLFVAEIFTTNSCLELIPCVKFIAPEPVFCLWDEIVKYPYG